MAIYDQHDDQISMENGDEWYFDQFGEYRNANAQDLEQEDIQADPALDEFDETPAPTRVGGDIIADDEFNETLQSEHIHDQLDDPDLQREAESDYQTPDSGPSSIGDKIKDKFHDLTGK